MIEKGRISPFELSILVVFYTVGTTVLAIPSLQTAKANQDAWLSSLIGITACVLITFFYFICAKAMGRESYLQYLQRVYGKILGKGIGFTYVYFAFIGTASLLFQFGNFISTQILAETPVEVLNLMLTLLVVIVVRAGLEVLARTGELLFPWFMILFFCLLVFLIPQMEPDRLSPLYEASIGDHFSAAIDFVSFGGFPLVIFLLFYPGNINNFDKSKWNFILGTFFGTIIVGIFVLVCILVLGAPATARQIYPSYVLAKSVSVFEIIERIESIIAGMWILSIFFKTAIYFYTCIIGLAELLSVQNYRFLVIPVAILAMIFSTVVYPDVTFMTNWDDKYWFPYSMIMGFVLPLITLLVDKAKTHYKNKNLNKGM